MTNTNLSMYKFGLVLVNDIMNHVDCVIKRTVYPQKIPFCF